MAALRNLQATVSERIGAANPVINAQRYPASKSFNPLHDLVDPRNVLKRMQIKLS